MDFEKIKEIVDAINTGETIETVLKVEKIEYDSKMMFELKVEPLIIENNDIVSIFNILLKKIRDYRKLAAFNGSVTSCSTLLNFEALLHEGKSIEEIGKCISTYGLEKHSFGIPAISTFGRCGWIVYPGTNTTRGLNKPENMKLGIYIAKLISSVKTAIEVYEKILKAERFSVSNADIEEFIKRRRERIEKARNNGSDHLADVKLKPKDDFKPKKITMFKIPPIVHNASEINIASSYPVDENTTYSKFIRVPDTGIDDLSDGYHTFNDLYYQRAVLFATIVNNNQNISWKSFKHEDGKYCFDKNSDWFIVGIDTPEGPYTYHYEKKYWDLFKCEELECGKHWDGHTEKDVTRLLSINTKNNEDEYLEQNILSLKYREDEYMKVADILDRFLTIDKYFKHTKWNLSQILSNLDMVMSVRVESEN